MLLDFMRSTQTMGSSLHCLDVFGASGRVKQTWQTAGYRGEGYDIRLSGSHDICGEAGVKILLKMALEKLGTTWNNYLQRIFLLGAAVSKCR